MDRIEDNERHDNVIIHIDIDCFYAQVEEIKDPSLCNKPVGIQQKNIIVTCNYKAREHGVTKLMLLTDAVKICPNLVIVNGEDLTDYKRMSAKIFDMLQRFSPKIEKLGLDENYIDVTNTIYLTISESSAVKTVEGYIYPENAKLSSCACGCEKKMILGSHLAKEIRNTLYSELGLTSCAGIAHNKLLAKLIGSKNKPNKQTVLIPKYAFTYMSTLESIRNITGIGSKTAQILEELGISSVTQLQDCQLEIINKKFDRTTSLKLKELSMGRDQSAIRPSTLRPKTIGLEDSCKSLSLRKDVEEKFRLLLIRLINQAGDDSRIPNSIKLTVRKYDPIKKTSHRETKQCSIISSLFRITTDKKLTFSEGGQEKLLTIIMRLFERIINLKQSFNITLLGLAFTKFQDNLNNNNSKNPLTMLKMMDSKKTMANFLIKKSDVEVQSITNLINFDNNNIRSSSSATCIPMDYDQISDNSMASLSGSESEIEPSPKKSRRLGLLIAKRRCFSSSFDDISSPSKLRVADLRLNSREMDVAQTSTSPPISSISNKKLKSTSAIPTTPTSSKKVPSTKNILNKTNLSTKLNSNTATIPPSVDQNIFNELPIFVQNELLTTWKHTQASIDTATSTSKDSNLTKVSTSTKTITSQTQTTQQKLNKSNSSQKGNNNSNSKSTNTLHRYFIRNK